MEMLYKRIIVIQNTLPISDIPTWVGWVYLRVVWWVMMPFLMEDKWSPQQIIVDED